MPETKKTMNANIQRGKTKISQLRSCDLPDSFP